MIRTFDVQAVGDRWQCSPCPDTELQEFWSVQLLPWQPFYSALAPQAGKSLVSNLRGAVAVSLPTPQAPLKSFEIHTLLDFQHAQSV